jgi:hypothetical protein
VKEVPEPAMSAGGEMDAPEAKVTPFDMGEGREEEPKKNGPLPPGQEQQQNHRQIIPPQQQRRPQQHQLPRVEAPPRDERELLSALRSTQLPPPSTRPRHNSAVTAPQETSRRPAIAPVPSVDPITYHRPPPFYPRYATSGVSSATVTRTPYDWLEARQNAELEAFLFHRGSATAATRVERTARNVHNAPPPSPVMGGAAALVGSVAGGMAMAMPFVLFLLPCWRTY